MVDSQKITELDAQIQSLRSSIPTPEELKEEIKGVLTFKFCKPRLYLGSCTGKHGSDTPGCIAHQHSQLLDLFQRYSLQVAQEKDVVIAGLRGQVEGYKQAVEEAKKEAVREVGEALCCFVGNLMLEKEDGKIVNKELSLFYKWIQEKAGIKFLEGQALKEEG